jgi:hypothetical protein
MICPDCHGIGEVLVNREGRPAARRRDDDHLPELRRVRRGLLLRCRRLGPTGTRRKANE